MLCLGIVPRLIISPLSRFLCFEILGRTHVFLRLSPLINLITSFARACTACTDMSQFEYRLTRCGELSLGLWSTATPDSHLMGAATAKTGRPVESAAPQNRQVLLAHVVASKGLSEVVTDSSMDYPKDWRTATPNVEPTGHRDDGRTICLHSLAVLPMFQGSGLGRTLLMAYIQHMTGAGIADRIALIAHDHLVGYYEKFGFINKGPSKATFGGGGWMDMVILFLKILVHMLILCKVLDVKPIDARVRYG